MIKILRDHKLFLASKSPRRKQLLEEANIPFQLITSEWPEDYNPTMKVEQVPQFLSFHKAEYVKEQLKDKEILLTADTVVIHQDQILGKPEDMADARRMLSLLSDDTHTVITGITLMSKVKIINSKSVSRVKFAPLNPNEIEYYINTLEPLDKSGAYGIQGWLGHCKVIYIEGSYPNVMGLPVHLVYEILANW